MAVSSEYTDYILELLEPLESASVRRMFGGAGIFCHGLMIALIADDQLYFKVDDENRDRFIDAGCEQFVYETKNGKRGLMSYYQAPDYLFDEQDEMVDWARSALDAALRADKKKPKKKKRR